MLDADSLFFRLSCVLCCPPARRSRPLLDTGGLPPRPQAPTRVPRNHANKAPTPTRQISALPDVSSSSSASPLSARHSSPVAVMFLVTRMHLFASDTPTPTRTNAHPHPTPTRHPSCTKPLRLPIFRPTLVPRRGSVYSVIFIRLFIRGVFGIIYSSLYFATSAPHAHTAPTPTKQASPRFAIPRPALLLFIARFPWRLYLLPTRHRRRQGNDARRQPSPHRTGTTEH
ncbi:hypothetical protein C8R43DRAFT_990649 [Mycena crocata]|nr:hypothetical protein C8R43DRAFT_990649 [Mycena crocata]